MMTQTAQASDCKLDLDQAHDIFIQYTDRHYEDLQVLVDQEKLDYIGLYIKEKTFYSEGFGRYFFPLTAIYSSKVKGHVWLELTCDEELSLSYYVEDI
jgi:hypothetical protein